MRYAFDTLMKVQFNHSYFADNVFNSLSINVGNKTMEVINNMGLLVKVFKGGFYILYDQNFTGKHRTREDVLNENLKFEFTLTLKDPHFYNYTANLPAQINNAIFYFNNSLKIPSASPNTNLLHNGEFVSEKDVYKLWYFKERFFNKPFAKLDLTLNSQLGTNYYINFKSKATYWRYIMMSDYLQQLNNPAIISTDNNDIFGKPLKINLPDDREVNAFVSSVALDLSQYASNTFQLVENYETGSSKYRVVIRALPIPDIHHLSGIAQNNKAFNYSDILIH